MAAKRQSKNGNIGHIPVNGDEFLIWAYGKDGPRKTLEKYLKEVPKARIWLTRYRAQLAAEKKKKGT